MCAASSRRFASSFGQPAFPPKYKARWCRHVLRNRRRELPRSESARCPCNDRQVPALVDHYMGNARILSEGARAAGFAVHGGTNAPYIWVETRAGQTSWQTFDWMLRTLNVVITPGSGFGSRGEGFFRVSAFNSRANAVEVARRLRDASGL